MSRHDDSIGPGWTFLLWVYGITAVLDWGYYLWWALKVDGTGPGDAIFVAIIFGWFPALFWPLHSAFAFWVFLLCEAPC